MTKIESDVQIEAPVEAVWDILSDTSYIVKLFRDAVTVAVDRPGRSYVGQKYHLIGKAARRKIEVNLVVVEVEPGTKVVTKQTPGGLFRTFKQSTTLEPAHGGTMARTTFEYELSAGYLGKVLNRVLIQTMVKDNLASYSSTLKDLSELLPFPTAEEKPASS
ncbi:MAG: SRPBCC family protein [Nitrososphaerales archaeon]|jgi:carbon monoxide dehydrogenase subunit G